ncbi:MAG: hypothetical protein AB1349_01620 [Elusimicrobiota bacterium]
MIDRSQPVYRIKIEGVDLEKFGYNFIVESVMTEEHDTLADISKVVIVNKDLKFTNDLMFLEKSKMEIFLGYPEELEYKGCFYLDEPKFVFPEQGTPKIILSGKGEEISLAYSEKRRVFRNITDSELAEKIAKEYGLKTDIEPTKKRYDQISQMNESDIALLHRRAGLHGFLVYVENGTLHFHPVRNEDSGIKLTYGGEQSSLLSFEVKEQLFLRALEVISTCRDKFKKTVVDVSSENEPDEFTKAQSDRDVRRSYEIAKSKQEQAKGYLLNSGHLMDAEELEEQTKSAGMVSQWFIEAEAKSIGLPKIKAKRIIEFDGLKNFSGKYYVKMARHMIRNGYTVLMDVGSTVTGNLRQGEPLSPVYSSSAGTRFPDREKDNQIKKSKILSVAEII